MKPMDEEVLGTMVEHNRRHTLRDDQVEGWASVCRTKHRLLLAVCCNALGTCPSVTMDAPKLK